MSKGDDRQHCGKMWPNTGAHAKYPRVPKDPRRDSFNHPLYKPGKGERSPHFCPLPKNHQGPHECFNCRETSDVKKRGYQHHDSHIMTRGHVRSGRSGKWKFAPFYTCKNCGVTTRSSKSAEPCGSRETSEVKKEISGVMRQYAGRVGRESDATPTVQRVRRAHKPSKSGRRHSFWARLRGGRSAQTAAHSAKADGHDMAILKRVGLRVPACSCGWEGEACHMNASARIQHRDHVAKSKFSTMQHAIEREGHSAASAARITAAAGRRSIGQAAMTRRSVAGRKRAARRRAHKFDKSACSGCGKSQNHSFHGWQRGDKMTRTNHPFRPRTKQHAIAEANAKFVAEREHYHKFDKGARDMSSAERAERGTAGHCGKWHPGGHAVWCTRPKDHSGRHSAITPSGVRVASWDRRGKTVKGVMAVHSQCGKCGSHRFSAVHRGKGPKFHAFQKPPSGRRTSVSGTSGIPNVKKGVMGVHSQCGHCGKGRMHASHRGGPKFHRFQRPPSGRRTSVRGTTGIPSVKT